MKNRSSLAPSDIRFLIVGAEKSGTTWLADMLRQHPRVFIPAQKELHYFNSRLDEAPELENYNVTKPLEWYLDFYRPAPAGRTLGEACPAYLWDESAAQRIHAFNPDVRILMILRNPVERFFSAYRYAIQRGILSAGAPETILEQHRALLLERGFYYRQVKRYLDVFPRSQVGVFWYDDLRRDSRAFLLSAEKFLGLEAFVPDNVSEEINAAGVPRFPILGRWLASFRRFTRAHRMTWLIEPARRLGLAEAMDRMRTLNKAPSASATPVDLGAFDRRQIYEFYADDIASLETLLTVDLRAWKQDAPNRQAGLSTTQPENREM